MIALLALVQDEGGGVHWANQHNIHPLALVMVVLLSFAMLAVRRQWAAGPFIVVIGFITVAQRFVVAGLDFPMLRVLVFVGWLRVMMRGEVAGFRFRGLDVLMIAWGLSQFCANSALAASMGGGALANALVNRAGWLVDNLGTYFLFRCLVRTWGDLEVAVKLLAVLAIPVSLLFLLEKSTGRNLFSVFGGVMEYTAIREGKLRCQGPFTHPILAGCFWAAVLPLFAGLWWAPRPWRLRAAVAIACALVAVVCTASSTPMGGAFVAIVAAFMFPLRGYLRLLQIGVPIMLMVLHLCMKAPVWHLISRIDLVGGSTGYHRYLLIDNTIRRFNEWWLFGARGTAHWGHQMHDITNHYVLQGITGGFAALVLFLATVVVAFRGIGRILRLNRLDRGRYMTAWLLGASLFAHCAMLMAVSYFHKPLLLWTMTLAAIPSLELASISAARRRAILASRSGGELGMDVERDAQSIRSTT